MNTQRVVITGFGAITPLGHTAKESWEAIKKSQSGVGWITQFDTTQYAVKIAGEVKNWNPEQYLPKKEIRRRDRHQLFIHAAVTDAQKHAGIAFETPESKTMAGTCIGSSFGGMTNFTEQMRQIDQHGPKKIAPFSIPSFMTTTASSMSGVMLGITGASYILTSACATGSDSIGHAYDQIRLGRANVMFAGAGEATIFPNSVAGFDRLGACSQEVEDIHRAMRPFDRSRKGLVIAEGAAVLVLESLEHAKDRGATIWAELVGYGATSDGFHIVAPHPEGNGAASAMQKALNDAGINPEQIDYINAHGTGTLLNDPMETAAIKKVFGEKAYDIPVSSTKSMTGHAMGATGAMEAVFSIFALQEGVVPATINLEEPDPACDLDYVPNVPREKQLNYIMSNAFGFGGHNSVLIFKAYKGD